MASPKKKKADKATVTRKQRLKRVKVQDFMRLETVEFEPRNGVIVICGKNDQGKSSLVTFMRAVLGGKYEFPDMPVRKGAKKSSGEIETDDFLWQWEFDPSKASPNTVTVRDKARGRNVKGPQGFTRALFGQFALDLMRFHHLEPREQLEYAQSVMRDKDGNPIDFEEYESEYNDFYEDRAEKRAALKSAAAVLEKNPPVENPPSERVDVTALSEEIEKATEQNTERERAVALANEADTRVTLAGEKVEDLVRQLEEARKELAAVEEEAVALHKKADALTTIDVEPLKKKRAEAGEINAAYDAQQDHEEARAEHEKYQKAFDAVEAALKEHVEEHKKRMEEGQWGVPGLEWKDGRFYYQDVPLSQNSTRNKIFVAWQLAMAENPDLPIVLIDDANVLDEDAQQYFAELSGQYEADTLMVMVGENVEGAQLTIRDGKVV